MMAQSSGMPVAAEPRQVLSAVVTQPRHRCLEGRAIPEYVCIFHCMLLQWVMAV